jgi:hypothetical protein
VTQYALLNGVPSEERVTSLAQPSSL